MRPNNIPVKAERDGLPHQQERILPPPSPGTGMTPQSQAGAWRIGEWIADPRDDTLSRSGSSIKVEPRLMQLLICLAESAPHVVSIERLLAEVWSGVIVGSASVYQSISQLRKTLGDTDSPPRYIETVARKGYRLVASAQRLVEEPVAVMPAPPLPVPVARPWFRHKGVLFGALAAVFVAFAGLALWRSVRVSTPEIYSIAVLPFTDLTPDRSDAPFCDGLTEELSSWLGQLPALNVVARTSAFAFRDKPTDVREIGRQLGTSHIVEGSVRREGNALRVTAKLVATASGYQLWTGSYDTSINNVLSVQEQIARAIAANLEVRLTQGTLDRFATRRTDNDSAYRLYLVARHHQEQRTRADNAQAIGLFRQVIADDADFALGYVGLAKSYINERYFSDRPISAIAVDVEPLLLKAQQLQPDLADLYVVRGSLATEQLRPDAALRDLQRAVTLDSNSRAALGELGFLYLTSGQPRDALINYTRAAALDPLDANLQAQRCLALQDLAQFEEAELACERARALEPRSAWVYSASAALEDSRGRIDRALRWNQEALRLSPEVAENLAQRGIWLLSLGLPERAADLHREATRGAADEAGVNAALLELGFLVAYQTGGAPALQAKIAATPIDAGTSPETLFTIAKAALLANDAKGARTLVDRALASSGLQAANISNPWLARTGDSPLIIAALAAKLTGDPAVAEKHLSQLSALLDRLTAAGMQRHGLDELRAQVAALRGQPEEAMRALQAAANLGWSGSWRAEREPYFASLRARIDYRNLIARISQANARMQVSVLADNNNTQRTLPASGAN